MPAPLCYRFRRSKWKHPTICWHSCCSLNPTAVHSSSSFLNSDLLSQARYLDKTCPENPILLASDQIHWSCKRRLGGEALRQLGCFESTNCRTSSDVPLMYLQSLEQVPNWSCTMLYPETTQAYVCMHMLT